MKFFSTLTLHVYGGKSLIESCSYVVFCHYKLRNFQLTWLSICWAAAKSEISGAVKLSDIIHNYEEGRNHMPNSVIDSFRALHKATRAGSRLQLCYLLNQWILTIFLTKGGPLVSYSVICHAILCTFDQSLHYCSSYNSNIYWLKTFITMKGLHGFIITSSQYFN